MLYGWHQHCLLGRNISRTTADNVHIVRICSDNMQMTCTYANNSSRNEMYITYASVDNIHMILTMCVCVETICMETKLWIIWYTRSVRDDKEMTCICVDHMQMTWTMCVCVETKLWIIGYMRSVRDEKQMMCMCVDSMQMTWTMCICVDNVQKLSCT